ncbi:tetratricopeptide repeat protein [Actinoallomurus iriomotensis]|uniref:Tetratricopeptide repeat protein n=1 Tax=Actinoallomurus iriomotensis TaxID=478107 RepID=A0A9W6S5D9_9ACTN|nr:tetratricopeptide repeat protein [Actinoallomurus iriomotensis]GLY87448.1 hypothetical protein Airi02_053770 [Actinoallomurus iriomotensis]
MRDDRADLGGLRWRWLPGDGLLAPSERQAAKLERRARATVQARAGLLGADHVETLGARFDVVRYVRARHRYEEAESQGRELLADCRRVLGPDHSYTARAHDEVAKALTARGRDAEAESELRAAVAAAHPGGGHLRLLLGLTLCHQGKFDEAISLCRDVIDDQRQAAGNESALLGMSFVANCCNMAGRHREAEQEARAMLRALPRPRRERRNQAWAAHAHQHLAVALSGLGQHAAAKAEIGSALTAARSSQGSAAQLAVSHMSAARILISLHDYDAAGRHARDAVRKAARHHGPAHVATCHCRVVLADVLHGRNRGSEAEAELRPVIAALPPENRVALLARTRLAAVLRGQERHVEAEAEARAAAAGLGLLFGSDHPVALSAQAELAEVLTALGRDDAHAERLNVLKARERVLGTDHPDTETSRRRLNEAE